MIEEIGFDSADRPSRTDADLRYWVETRGARGYMQWGFTAVTPDNGNGDSQFGMDHLGHARDWDALNATYAAAAARIR